MIPCLPLVAALLLLQLGDGLVRQSSPPCTFNVVHAVTPPRVNEPATVLARSLVLPQPGSPVVIESLDLAGTEFSLERGQMSFTLHWAIELQNVSDVPVNNVKVLAHFLHALPRNGTVEGQSPIALRPGERTRITWEGRGSASPVSPQEAFLFAFVDSVQFGNCTYTAAPYRRRVAERASHRAGQQALAADAAQCDREAPRLKRMSLARWCESMEPSTEKPRYAPRVRSELLALLGAVAIFVTAPGGAKTEAGTPRTTLPTSAQCPKETPLEPGVHARDRAIGAVRKSLATGPDEWRTYEIQSAYPATNGKGFSVVAFPMCGPVVGSRTWVVEIRFPKLEPSASLSQGQAFVSRFRSGWRVWYRYH
jgi:hypothetical protein